MRTITAILLVISVLFISATVKENRFQTPVSVVCKSFPHSLGLSDEMRNYILTMCSKGWIVKSVAMCGSNYNGGETGIVVLEKY